MVEEARLLAELPLLSDLQSSWLLLRFCAEPRANHLLRSLPPTLSAEYAQAHDAALWHCLLQLLGETTNSDNHADLQRARGIASLPACMGGLGLRSAALHAPAAYWAGWADALLMLLQRQPLQARRITEQLTMGESSQAACLREASAAGRLLVHEGFSWLPSWSALLAGERPPQPDDNLVEPGSWNHGWQYYASLHRNLHFRSTQLLPTLDDASYALLRSQSGPEAGSWLTAIPTEDATRMPPLLFQVALRRRLRLALPMRPRRCGEAGHPGCNNEVDAFGDHEAACPRTGLLGRRGRAVERTWTRVAGEAVAGEGHVIPQQWMANIAAQDVPHDDRRRLDLVIYGASPAGHVLCCDATVVSPLTSAGLPIPRAAAHDGAANARAEQRKRRTYPELCGTRAQRLQVLACEVGGRWNTGSLDLVALLVHTRMRRTPQSGGCGMEEKMVGHAWYRCPKQSGFHNSAPQVLGPRSCRRMLRTMPGRCAHRGAAGTIMQQVAHAVSDGGHCGHGAAVQNAT